MTGYVECEDFEQPRRAMEGTDVNARWQREMAPFFKGLEGMRPDEGMAPLPEISPPRLSTREVMAGSIEHHTDMSDRSEPTLPGTSAARVDPPLIGLVAGGRALIGPSSRTSSAIEVLGLTGLGPSTRIRRKCNRCRVHLRCGGGGEGR